MDKGRVMFGAMEEVVFGQPAAAAVVAQTDRLRASRMPRSPREVGVGAEHFERISAQAMVTPWIPRNPRRIDGPAEMREILALAA